jgi:signal transduction histidine kinase
MNFGLGLSYCFNVMQKHGGSLDIFSKENIGTTVFLSFPNKRAVRLDPKIPEWSTI